MTDLKIEKNYRGISKTLRIPQNIVSDIETLSQLKGTSLNQIVILLLKFSLDNLDLQEKEAIEKFRLNENS